MEIQTVSLIGLGALGILHAQQLAKHLQPEALRIIADSDRIARYTKDGIFCNGEPCRFSYVAPEDNCTPADLLLIAVKFNDLDEAITSVKGHVGPDTIILSLLNGIASEEIIGQGFGREKVLLCVAQGMDATKTGNNLIYHNPGLLSFGDQEPGVPSEKVRRVERFFLQTGIPHEVVPNMKRRQWSKFMFNAGVNQVTALYRCDYEGVQEGGAYRQTMIDAMGEVAILSGYEGVDLNQADIGYWMDILQKLNPKGKTSMQQDIEARRFTEVAMFSGTILELGKKRGLNFSVNQMLYDQLKKLEQSF